jgi:hypothetical protein
MIYVYNINGKYDTAEDMTGADDEYKVIQLSEYSCFGSPVLVVNELEDLKELGIDYSKIKLS